MVSANMVDNSKSLDVLIGVVCSQVCFGHNELVLHFDNDMSLTIERPQEALLRPCGGDYYKNAERIIKTALSDVRGLHIEPSKSVLISFRHGDLHIRLLNDADDTIVLFKDHVIVASL